MPFTFALSLLSENIEHAKTSLTAGDEEIWLFSQANKSFQEPINNGLLILLISSGRWNRYFWDTCIRLRIWIFCRYRHHKRIKGTKQQISPGSLFGCIVSFVVSNPCIGTYRSNRKFTGKLNFNDRFYARDVKVVWTDLTSETLKSSVKCVVRTHLTEDVKVVCLIYRFYTDDFNVSSIKTASMLFQFLWAKFSENKLLQ